MNGKFAHSDQYDIWPIAKSVQCRFYCCLIGVIEKIIINNEKYSTSTVYILDELKSSQS